MLTCKTVLKKNWCPKQWAKENPMVRIYHNHCNPCEVNVKTSYILCTLQECMYICTNFKHIIKLYILKIFFKKSKTIQNWITSIIFKSLHCSSPWRTSLWISAFLANTDAPTTWQAWPPPWKWRLQKMVSLGSIWYFMMSMLSTRCPQCHLKAGKALATIHG